MPKSGAVCEGSPFSNSRYILGCSLHLRSGDVELIGNLDHPIVPQSLFEPITAMETQLALAFYQLDTFPNLRALYIVFAPEEDDYLSNLRRQRFIFSMLCDVELHSLKSLTIKNHIALPAQLYWDPDFYCLFNSLSHLHLSVLPQCDDGLEYHGDFWVGVVRLRILRHVALSQCLVSLSLRSVSDNYDDPMGFAIPFSFKEIDLHLLESFSLQYFLLGDGTCDGIDFIRRHAYTLRTLELNSCPLLLPSTGPLRFWSGIWNCFAEELKALTSLQVDDDESIDMYALEKDSWYEIIRYGCSEFTEDLPELPDQKEDDRALEGLKVLVVSRRLS